MRTSGQLSGTSGIYFAVSQRSFDRSCKVLGSLGSSGEVFEGLGTVLRVSWGVPEKAFEDLMTLLGTSWGCLDALWDGFFL